MHTLLIFFALTFGAIIGSFLNVVIFRMNTGRTLGGRSMCLSCGKTLHAGELVPILSYVFLGGKCSACKSTISPQYPLVEAVSAFFSALLALRFEHVLLGGSEGLFYLTYLFSMSIFSFLLIMSVYDIRHKIIPDAALWPFIVLSFFSPFNLFSMPFDSWKTILMFLVSGPLVALPLYLLWRFSQGKAMGFGDVKFSLGIGWLLGFGYGYLALMYAFVLGAIIGVGILLPWGSIVKGLHSLGITRFRMGDGGFTMKSEVPFGPFLIIGTCIVWFALIHSFTPALTLFGVLPSSSSWW